MYDYDNTGQRPSSRGSKQHMENGNNYGASSSSHGYTIQHSSSAGQQRHDDEDEDMW